jgi:hypothetical protein
MSKKTVDVELSTSVNTRRSSKRLSVPTSTTTIINNNSSTIKDDIPPSPLSTTSKRSTRNKNVETTKKEENQTAPVPTSTTTTKSNPKRKSVSKKEEDTPSTPSKSSTNDEIDFTIGTSLEVLYTPSNEWFHSRIIKIDSPNKRIKVHFLGWNSRYDSWHPMNSSNLRTYKQQDDSKSIKSNSRSLSTSSNTSSIASKKSTKSTTEKEMEEEEKEQEEQEAEETKKVENQRSSRRKSTISTEEIPVTPVETITKKEKPNINTKTETKGSPIDVVFSEADLKRLAQNTNPKNRVPHGGKVAARWIDLQYYEANVYRYSVKNGILYYGVRFNDGIEKQVRYNFIKSLDQKENDEKEKTERRAEAELLLAIQQPKVNTSTLTNNEDDTEPDKIEGESMEIDTNEPLTTLNNQKDSTPQIIEQNKEEPQTETETKDIPIQPDQIEVKLKQSTPIPPSTPTITPIRKSLRAKTVRTFTKEIIFDSPGSSITYTATSAKVLEKIKKEEEDKLAQAQQILTAKAEAKAARELHQSENHSESVTTDTPSTSVQDNKRRRRTESTAITPEVSSKRSKKAQIIDQSKNKKRKSVLAAKVTAAKETLLKKNRQQNEQKNKLLISKHKKDKKRLFKKFIEASKLQLQQQQELIELQLKKHQDKKSKKRLEKQKRRQQQQQQQSQQDENLLINQENTALLMSMSMAAAATQNAPQFPTTIIPNYADLLSHQNLPSLFGQHPISPQQLQTQVSHLNKKQRK